MKTKTSRNFSIKYAVINDAGKEVFRGDYEKDCTQWIVDMFDMFGRSTSAHAPAEYHIRKVWTNAATD